MARHFEDLISKVWCWGSDADMVIEAHGRIYG